MPHAILDHLGRPASFQATGNLYARDDAMERLRPSPPNHYDDYLGMLPFARYKALVSESRAVGARGIVAAAIQQKADYVSQSQWRPFFYGEDVKYGEQVEQLLHDTTSLVCTRGPRYDWRTLWKLAVSTSSYDGGTFVLLTEGANNWPLLQPIEAHRVGQRESGVQVVKADSAWTAVKNDEGIADWIPTPYFGLRIANGIIYNNAGFEVAFRVLGATVEDDEDISARDMVFLAPPRWYSEGRPIPQLAPALEDLLGVGAARRAQLSAQIAHSKLTLIEKNDTGRQDPMRAAMNPPAPGSTPNGTAPEVMEDAMWRYVKNNGSGIEAHEAKVPSNEWMNFDLRTLASSIAAMGWRLEMLDPSGLAGAATRAFQDQINTLIGNCFQDMRPGVQRCLRYIIAKHTKNGLLPENRDFLKFDITAPPDFVVDRNSAKIDVDMVRAGADSMPNVQRRSGLRSRQVLIEQAAYLKAKKEIAAQFGVEETELGTLSQPGDELSQQAALDTTKSAPAPKKSEPSDE